MDKGIVVHDLTVKLLNVSSDSTPDSVVADYYDLLAKVDAAVEKRLVKQGMRTGRVV